MVASNFGHGDLVEMPDGASLVVHHPRWWSLAAHLTWAAAWLLRRTERVTFADGTTLRLRRSWR